MANREHLKVAMQGSEEWNWWREANPDTLPNLSEASLIWADLSWVDLSGAHLNKADLTGADLTGADLTRANLTGANLTEAVLYATMLISVNLRGACLRRAKLMETLFVDTDLSAVNGLESCVHAGPCTIDHRTLARSGKLPLRFLRGCGLPDFIIENIAVGRVNQSSCI